MAVFNSGFLDDVIVAVVVAVAVFAKIDSSFSLRVWFDLLVDLRVDLLIDLRVWFDLLVAVVVDVAVLAKNLVESRCLNS